MDRDDIYQGRWRDIPRDAITDYIESAIKHNYNQGRYGVTAVMVGLMPSFVPFGMLAMGLDKLLLTQDTVE